LPRYWKPGKEGGKDEQRYISKELHKGFRQMSEELLWLIMPVGSTHGWGVCGKYLGFELSRLANVKFITDNFESEANKDHDHYKSLYRINTSLDHINPFKNAQGTYSFHEPVLQAIEGANLKPWLIEAMAPKKVGYTFYEKSSLNEEDISRAKNYFDWVVAGSTWCENILKNCGLRQSSTIIQGVDTDRFHTGYSEKRRFKDKFVIFSGGKIEYRKGQDLVIRAFKVLQDKYDDVLLVNCWYNQWDSATATMSMSPHIRFEMPKGDYLKAIHHLLKINDVNPEKVIVLPPIDNRQIAEIYQNSDCGLFPNRCEGGTNLVLMEYMACGKPVIASNNTGQMDVLSDNHSILLKDQRPLNLRQEDGSIYTSWYEPNLDEIVNHLEWAYHNRDRIKEIGLAGSRFISQHTWARAAKQFYRLMFHNNSG
jgi:glycosyltransferase involved in cell wall biosynthesis